MSESAPQVPALAGAHQPSEPPDFKRFRDRLSGLLQEFEQMEAWSLTLYNKHMHLISECASGAHRDLGIAPMETIDVDSDGSPDEATKALMYGNDAIEHDQLGPLSFRSQKQSMGSLDELTTAGPSMKGVMSMLEVPTYGSQESMEVNSFLGLVKWFDLLDKDCLQALTLQQVARIMEQRVQKRSDDDLRKLLMKVNEFTAYVEKSVSSYSHLIKSYSQLSSGTARNDETVDVDEVVLPRQSFMHLVWWHDIQAFVKPQGESLTSELLDLREALILDSVEELIERNTNWRRPSNLSRGDRIRENRFVDYTVAFIILANAVVIGIRIGREAQDFLYLEAFFTLFFVIELGFNIWAAKGLGRFLLGSSWMYNTFDLCIVLLGIFGFISEYLFDDTDDNALGSVTLGRLVRLFRFTKILRLMRILRIEIFKPLNMMIKGVIVGMRTLIWAIVLMLLIVYTCSIVLTQTVGEARLEDSNNMLLFNNLETSMFAVFRCFMGDCALSDGTPMPVMLERKYGVLFTIPFGLTIIFVVFGLCNLIMAIFVDTVQEAAKQKISMKRDAEIACVWLSMRELVLRLGGVHKGHRAIASTSDLIRFGSSGKHLMSSPSSSRIEDGMAMHEKEVFFPHGAHITSGMFHGALEDPDIWKLFDDLEIYVPHKLNIFSVLDSDGNQDLDISEVISGMLKLRSGGADRSDVVEMCLMIKSVQTKVTELAHMFKETQQQMPQQRTGTQMHTFSGARPRT